MNETQMIIPLVIGIVERDGKILVVEYEKTHRCLGGLILPPTIPYPREEDEGDEPNKLAEGLFEQLGARFKFSQSRRGRIFRFSCSSENVIYVILPFKGDVVSDEPFPFKKKKTGKKPSKLSSDIRGAHWVTPFLCLQARLGSIFSNSFDQFGIKIWIS